jgi:predicted phage replisome organizer
MAENAKYFYMWLKENFFESEEMILLESLPDGMLYQNILLKMYCKSLKNEGKLMLNAEMIAKLTNHQVGTVEKALEIFQQMGIIDITDNGTIYMLNIQNSIGKSSN